MSTLAIDLAGHTVLVTGGSRGIGAATCIACARAGARVAVHYQKEREAAERVVAACQEAGTEAVSFRADVSSSSEVARLFDEMGRMLGPADRVVVNAGIWKTAPIGRMTDAELREMLEVNVNGVFYTMREFVRRLGDGPGAAVLISSTAGQRGEAFHSHYAASKGAVISLTKSLAPELAPRVRVNCVAPGWVDTDMSRASLDDSATRKWILDAIPLRRVGTADELAWPIVFLLSDLAAFITGEIFNVNGGAVLAG